MNDTAAFIEAIKRHDRGLRVLAYRLLRDRVAMDDVLQEAYLKAFRGRSGFRGEAQSGTWLYRIVYNACLDRLRSERRSREVSLESLTGSALEPAVGAAADWVVRRGDLAAALATLPPDQRAAVLLVDAMGFSYADAAEVVGARPGTIGSRLNHAHSVLRNLLAEGRDHEGS
jgi:RNA polymerase sigma-70 factor (ECF subfamily)